MPAFSLTAEVRPSVAQVRQIVNLYANRPIFLTSNELILKGNPYRRPVRPQDMDSYDFTAPLEKGECFSASALAAQRLLLNIYESDLMFLPDGPLAPVRQDFDAFYADDTRLAGEVIRPTLENHLFGFLEKEIDISGSWNVPAMRAFFDSRLEEANRGASPMVQKILGTAAPEQAAKTFLIQLAGDFLTEASAMARNTLGNFGAPLSELFKVLIDEYGYGVHDKKHSTMFEDTLSSVGLLTSPHAYWQFYLGSSIGLINYFHFVSKNHANFFRYLGALYYTEATLSVANRHQSRMLKEVFGPEVNTLYFDEHVHIDVHHGKMAIERIIEPLIERCGPEIIPEVIRGFEEFRVLQEIADKDLMDQIEWWDERDEQRRHATELLQKKEWLQDAPTATFREQRDELSTTHVHDDAELFVVEEGQIDLLIGHEQSVTLNAGEAIVIPKQRLHGSIVRSEACTYRVHSLRGA